MHSRREFLQTGIAAFIVPIAMPAHVLAVGTPRTARMIPATQEFFSVVYDVRFEDATLLAVNAERSGLPVTRITGDITDFWFKELSVRWKQSPVAIAGITAHGPLFCLERLGWDHGMRVAYRGVHPKRARSGPDEELLSWVIAPRPRGQVQE